MNKIHTQSFGEYYDEEPPIAMKLEDHGRFSADGRALIIGNSESTTVIPHGPNLPAVAEGDWNRVYDRDLQELDILPSKDMLVTLNNDVGSLSNSFTGEQIDDVLIRSVIQGKGLNADNPTFSYVQETTFYDSTSYSVSELYAPRFNEKGDVIYIEKESQISIDNTTGDQNVVSENYWLFLTNETENPDTLFTLPSSLTETISDLDLRVGENAVLISSGDLLTLFSFEGDLLYQTHTNGEFNLSNDGLSFSFNAGKQYYRASDEKLINLANINSRIIHSQPYENYILLIDNMQRLSVLDANLEKQTAIYSVGDFPDIINKTGKATIQKIHFPVITSEDKVKVLLGDKYVIDDPDDPCDVNY